MRESTVRMRTIESQWWMITRRKRSSTDMDLGDMQAARSARLHVRRAGKAGATLRKYPQSTSSSKPLHHPTTLHDSSAGAKSAYLPLQKDPRLTYQRIQWLKDHRSQLPLIWHHNAQKSLSLPLRHRLPANSPSHKQISGTFLHPAICHIFLSRARACLRVLAQNIRSTIIQIRCMVCRTVASLAFGAHTFKGRRSSD